MMTRLRRLALWLGFFLSEPAVLLAFVVGFAVPLAAGAAAAAAAWRAGGAAMFVVPFAAAGGLILGGVLSSCAVASAAAARLLERPARARDTLRAAWRGLLASPRLIVREPLRNGQQQELNPLVVPAMVCDGLPAGEALRVCEDLRAPWAPLFGELISTSDGALFLVLIGVAAAGLFFLMGASERETSWVLWRGGMTLAALAGVLFAGAAAGQVGAVAAYLYATSGEDVRRRAARLLEGMPLEPVRPPPAATLRSQAEDRLNRRLENERWSRSPQGRRTRYTMAAILVAACAWMYFGLGGAFVRAVGVPADGIVDYVSDEEMRIGVNFQATKDYAPRPTMSVTYAQWKGLKRGDRVRVRFLKLYPDWAVLEEGRAVDRRAFVLFLLMSGWLVSSVLFPRNQ